MVLLDLLKKTPDIDVVVAHFNHGIRADAGQDERLVREEAVGRGLKLEVGHGRLGAAASEARARTARYEFLRSVKKKYAADKIITAHHRDDLIETAILNILRGTGPRGLVAIADNQEILRPLLGYDKSQIRLYAKRNKIIWREDASNSDEKYLRNLVRSTLAARLSGDDKKKLLDNIGKVAEIEKTKDELIATLSHSLISGHELNRAKFRQLPFEVGSAVLHGWLKQSRAGELSRQLIVRLNNFVRTAQAGSDTDVDKNTKLSLDKTSAKLETKT